MLNFQKFSTGECTLDARYVFRCEFSYILDCVLGKLFGELHCVLGKLFPSSRKHGNGN